MDAPAATPEDGRTPPSNPPASRLLRLTDATLAAFRAWGFVLLLAGLAVGLAIWPLLHHEEMGFILTGKLDSDLRGECVRFMLVSLAVVVALYLLAYAALRRRVPRLSLGEAFARLNRYTFVLICTPLLTALMYPGLETSHEFVTLILIVVITACFGVLIYRLVGLGNPVAGEPRGQLGRPWLPFAVTFALFAFYAGYFSYLAVLDHRNLGTHIFDLGIYDNIFWHNANGEFMGCSYCKTGKHMSSHFDPMLWLLSPIYRVAPRAETILVLQSVWLATGVFPLYFIGKRRLGNPWHGTLLGLIYIFYPALHGANMFDFHSLTLVIPLVMWAIYLVDAGSRWRFAGMLGLVLLTREDMSFLACFIGLYAILSRRPGLGFATIFVSLSYLAAVKLMVMNDPGLIMSGNKESTSFHYFYAEMIPHEDEGMRGLVITMVTDPVFALQVLFKEQKVFYFLALLLPLLGLPLVAGRKIVMSIYGFVFIGMATRYHVYSLHFQYSSVLFPVFLAALPDGIARASGSRIARAYGLRKARLVPTLYWTVFVATLLTNHKYGGMWANDHFKAGWNRLSRLPSEEKTERYAFVRDIVAQIPEDASVCSTSGLGPHVSNRANAKKWPAYREADFLLLHIERFKGKSRRRIDRLVDRGVFRPLAEDHGIGFYGRVPEGEEGAARAAARERNRKATGGSRARPSLRPVEPGAELEDFEELEVENPHRGPTDQDEPIDDGGARDELEGESRGPGE